MHVIAALFILGTGYSTPYNITVTHNRFPKTQNTMDGVRQANELRSYREKHKLDDIIADAIASAHAAGAKNPYAHIAEVLAQLVPEETAPGFDDQTSVNNDAKTFIGVLKHKAPKFSYFDPANREDKTVVMHEVKLPLAEQTHEVCYDPVTNCIYASQMSSSVLVRIPINQTNGLLLDDADAWTVGETNENGKGISGLHNVSLSPSNPGCLWLSLQFENTIVLVEGSTMNVLRVLHVPTSFKDESGKDVRIGGPHCIRENPKTGDVWVALKGALSCHPIPPLANDENVEGGNARVDRLKTVMKRVCCSPDALSKFMADINQRDGFDCPPPEGFAVWRISVNQYDATKPNRGGHVYACRPSPPMLAFDFDGNCFVAQDRCSCIMRIDAKTHECSQIKLPSCNEDGLRTHELTGPGICTAPNGHIWIALLGEGASFCRLDPATMEKTLYKLPVIPWSKRNRLIHFEFCASLNEAYALSSDLLDDEATNCIIKMKMATSSFENIEGIRIIPLPHQDCACHRICAVKASSKAHFSLVVSEMETSKLFQVFMQHVELDYGVSVEKFDKFGDDAKWVYRAKRKELS